MIVSLIRSAVALLVFATCTAAVAQGTSWALHSGQFSTPLGVQAALVLPFGVAGNQNAPGGAADRWADGPDLSRWAAGVSVSVTHADALARATAAETPVASLGLYGVYRFNSAGHSPMYASAGLVYEGRLPGQAGLASGAPTRSAWAIAMQTGFEVPRHAAWDVLAALKKNPRAAPPAAFPATLRWSPARVSLKLAPVRISAGTTLWF